MFGRFLDPAARKVFFEAFKEIQALWEILGRDVPEPHPWFRPLDPLGSAPERNARPRRADTCCLHQSPVYKALRRCQDCIWHVTRMPPALVVHN